MIGRALTGGKRLAWPAWLSVPRLLRSAFTWSRAASAGRPSHADAVDRASANAAA